jgi:hypothetical protein
MAKIIIKQPNGLYAVWSTVVDAFTLFNGSKEEVEEYIFGQQLADMKRSFEQHIKEADKGDSGYSWEDAVRNQWYYHARLGHDQEEWDLIKELDPNAPKYVESIVINEDGEWVSG